MKEIEELEREFTGVVQWFHNQDGVVAAVGEIHGEIWAVVQFTLLPQPRRIFIQVMEIFSSGPRLPGFWLGEGEVNLRGVAHIALPYVWKTLLASPLTIVVNNADDPAEPARIDFDSDE